MIRVVLALTGLAVFGALFAGIYYAPGNLTLKEEGDPAFRLAAGEVEQTTLQPTLAGTPILIQLQTFGGPLDIYVLEKDWSDVLPVDGVLRLDRPFSYDARRSLLGVEGQAEVTLVSDGKTSYIIIFDNSDNYYDGDTAPDPDSPTLGQVDLLVTVRYVEEESRSLVFGYLATIPSLALVALTLWRKWRRGRRAKQSA